MDRSEIWSAAGGGNKAFNAGVALLHGCKQINTEAAPFLYHELIIDSEDAENLFGLADHTAGMVKRLAVNFNCFCRSPRRLAGDISTSRQSSSTAQHPDEKDLIDWASIWKTHLPKILGHNPDLKALAIVFETCSRLKMKRWRRDLHGSQPLCHAASRIEVLDLAGTVLPCLGRRLLRRRSLRLVQGPELFHNARLRYRFAKKRSPMGLWETDMGPGFRREDVVEPPACLFIPDRVYINESDDEAEEYVDSDDDDDGDEEEEEEEEGA
ncbi:hypothetical protein QBC44DRAFT_374437 [Cladorrhinum sp. PSN332]|nr:hypothetical protein QBC44DRAFT_374437 [Cladorrhinum sp. PSN332]